MREPQHEQRRPQKGFSLDSQRTALVTERGGHVNDMSLSDDLRLVGEAKEMHRRGARLADIGRYFGWGYAKTRRVLDSQPPPPTCDWAPESGSFWVQPGYWANPLVHGNWDRTYDTRWSDHAQLVAAYADWTQRHHSEPRPSDWERKDPKGRRPTRRTVLNRTTWERLAKAGRQELRARSYDQ